MAATHTPWPHSPLHRLHESGTFCVTAATLHKIHHFRGPERLGVLHRGLLSVARDFGWRLEAWAVFSNHYHFIGHAPIAEPKAAGLSDMLSVLHVKTAGWLNRLERTPGRQVWFNFWETRLTYPRSYFARLNYVHQNPVRHGLVRAANQYPWCSAAWFEREASRASVKSISGFKTNHVKMLDDFEAAAGVVRTFVLECASPLALGRLSQSGGGPPHSKAPAGALQTGTQNSNRFVSV